MNEIKKNSPPDDKGSEAEALNYEYSRTRVVEVDRKNFSQNKMAALEEDAPGATAFKLLRTRIFQLTREKQLNCLQITGFGVNEGKSLVASNLAVSIAGDTRQTTLLVDLDFRRPAVHSLFGLEPEAPSLASYFEENKPLEDILVNPGIPNLTLLPAAGGVPNPTELMGSSKMEALVQELKERYKDRYIIFDTPSVNLCPDPLVISEYMDGLILVARAEQATYESIEAAMDKLPREKCLGVVFNDIDDYESPDYYRYYNKKKGRG